MWIAAGDRLIRAHDGSCFIYHPSGAFQVFKGVPPENLLFAVKDTLLLTEGILRMLPGNIRRDNKSVLDAVQGLLNNATADGESLSMRCNNAALAMQRDSKSGDDDDNAEPQVQNPVAQSIAAMTTL